MKICPSCGNSAADTMKFCIKCGTRLTDAVPEGQQPAEAAVEQPIEPAAEQPVESAAEQPAEQSAEPAAEPAAPHTETPTADIPQPQTFPVQGQPAEINPNKQNKQAKKSRKNINNQKSTNAKSNSGKAAVIIGIILAVICLGLAAALIWLDMTDTKTISAANERIAELEAEETTLEEQADEWQSKYQSQKDDYDELQSSYDALESAYDETGSEYTDLNNSWQLMLDTVRNNDCKNNDMSFESGVYAVKAGKSVMIEGKWNEGGSGEIYMGTDYEDIISVEWVNSGSTPYIKTSGLNPGVAVIKLGSDNDCTENAFALVVIVYE